MQLETLSATRDHTVLIDIKAFQNGKLIPYKGQHVWDGNHVKLPPDSPPSGFQSRWKVTQKALNKLMRSKASVRDIEEAIKTYNQAYRVEWGFSCLYSFEKRVQPQDSIFSQVIPNIAKLALQLPDLIEHPIPLLRQQHSHAITLSQEQISCLLANAFFCTFPHRNVTKPGSEYSNFPTINFSRCFDFNTDLVDRSFYAVFISFKGPIYFHSLFGDSYSCARKTEKLRCLFHYFNTVTDKDKKPEGLVTFERICIPENKLPTWKKQKETLTNLHVTSEGSIEKEGSGMLQVDFASKFIGGGVLGRGLTHEEIRFLMSPELIVARLFTEKLADNECLRITGAQTYSITSGYSDSFNWDGPCEDATKRDEWKRRYCQIVAIDALSFRDPREQYTKDNIKRELNKAYVGFRKDPNMPANYTPAIATGNWGCGACNGDPRLKALIQMMAAAVAERDLAFFTFGNKNQAQELQRMHHFLKTHQVTVG
ncbi:hypothetical protein NFI96_034317 [Prochilodus magdalenae]|nr:hypothetical protein NFI96_034317 [Prochilodus magdalenae]